MFDVTISESTRIYFIRLKDSVWSNVEEAPYASFKINGWGLSLSAPPGLGPAAGELEWRLKEI